MINYQRLVHTKWRFYNKCWGDIINGVTTNIIFLQKNKHIRLTCFTIKVSKS